MVDWQMVVESYGFAGAILLMLVWMAVQHVGGNSRERLVRAETEARIATSQADMQKQLMTVVRDESTERRDLRAQMDGVNKENRELLKRLDHEQAETRRVHKALTDALNKRERMEHTVGELEKRVGQLEAQVRELEEDRKRYKMLYETERDRADDLERALNEKAEALARLKAQLDTPKNETTEEVKDDE